MQTRIDVAYATFILIAPDEGRTPIGGPSWVIKLEGTPNEYLATKGRILGQVRRPEIIIIIMRDLAFENISTSMLTDEEMEKIERAVLEFFAKWQKSLTDD